MFCFKAIDVLIICTAGVVVTKLVIFRGRSKCMTLTLQHVHNELWRKSRSSVQFFGELNEFFVKVRTNENVTILLQSDR